MVGERGRAHESGQRARHGAPAIAEEVPVGRTLAASTDGIEDADELVGVFAFQWIADRRRRGGRHRRRDGAAKRSRTRSSGSRYRASFTEDAGHGAALTSAATAPVERPPLSAACRDVSAGGGCDGVASGGGGLRGRRRDLHDQRQLFLPVADAAIGWSRGRPRGV